MLLPAVMTLLGERDWYLPTWLRWLPDLTHDESAPATRPAAVPVGVLPGPDRDDRPRHARV